MRNENFTNVAVIRGRIWSAKWNDFRRKILRHNGRCQLYENIAILKMKNLHFVTQRDPPLKLDKMTEELKGDVF